MNCGSLNYVIFKILYPEKTMVWINAAEFMQMLNHNTPLNVLKLNTNENIIMDNTLIVINNAGWMAQPLELYNEKAMPDNSAIQLPITLSNNASCKSL